MGDLTQGFDGLCFERPARSKCQRAQQVSARAASVSARSKCAASVSARQERVPARYVRAARSVFRVMQTTVGGFGG